METDSPVVYHGTSESRFPPAEIQKHIKMLTKEERDVFQACSKESFYYRSLPLALAGIAATQIAVKRGILTPHPVWGAGLKMIGATFIGWAVGKLSYRKKCEEKFLTLENSEIANAIRRSRGYSIDSEFTKPKPSEDDFGHRDSSYTSYSDDYHSSSGSLNLDVDKNIQYSGLDDRERPSTDRETMPASEEVELERRFTTYDDLRRKNREDYEQSQRSYNTSRLDQTNQPPVQRPWSDVDNTRIRRSTTDPGAGETKNIYGDSWDNAKFL